MENYHDGESSTREMFFDSFKSKKGIIGVLTILKDAWYTSLYGFVFCMVCERLEIKSNEYSSSTRERGESGWIVIVIIMYSSS